MESESESESAAQQLPPPADDAVGNPSTASAHLQGAHSHSHSQTQTQTHIHTQASPHSAPSHTHPHALPPPSTSTIQMMLTEDYTRIYPVRSLLSDVQPDPEGSTGPASIINIGNIGAGVGGTGGSIPGAAGTGVPPSISTSGFSTGTSSTLGSTSRNAAGTTIPADSVPPITTPNTSSSPSPPIFPPTSPTAMSAAGGGIGGFHVLSHVLEADKNAQQRQRLRRSNSISLQIQLPPSLSFDSLPATAAARQVRETGTGCGFGDSASTAPTTRTRSEILLPSQKLTEIDDTNATARADTEVLNETVSLTSPADLLTFHTGDVSILRNSDSFAMPAVGGTHTETSGVSTSQSLEMPLKADLAPSLHSLPKFKEPILTSTSVAPSTAQKDSDDTPPTTVTQQTSSLAAGGYVHLGPVPTSISPIPHSMQNKGHLADQLEGCSTGLSSGGLGNRLIAKYREDGDDPTVAGYHQRTTATDDGDIGPAVDPDAPSGMGSGFGGGDRSGNENGRNETLDVLNEEENSMSGSECVSGSDGDEGEGEGGETEVYFRTTRFKHVETSQGHYLLLGREGQLERCEDEPIRTPGAVQGFGVLIALEEDEETGNLVVRQVSENCTELLGLTPHYLFSLESFTETLPDHQADILWDNIQYLDEDPDSLNEDGPQIFLLSGYGQPGSVIIESGESGNESDAGVGGASVAGSFPSGSETATGTTSSGGVSEERRHWTCWCAAHRAKAGPGTTQGGNVSGNSAKGRQYLSGELPVSSSTNHHIILEFELERDIYNPLYPPADLPIAARGPLSPPTTSRSDGISSSASISGKDSVGSDRTSTKVESGTPPPQHYTPPTHRGLEGDEDWMPSAEAIYSSTTNRAKPIKALERMRWMERTAHQRLLQQVERGSGGNRQGYGSQQRSRRGGRGINTIPRSGGTGTLDVFAVLAQVNEQLSAAPDLQTFLDVAVGVMKDLTQFHRVLVYQFDEHHNGFVPAEIVDWTRTHDLYKGLHFPATDIPAQARQLYKINKVRSLYDRRQPTARLVGRTREDVDRPLDLTHSYLRAMSPIHLKYLANMAVRGSMSISIVAFGQLWGLICCHSYGDYGMRVSFPVRQMLRLLSHSISRNVERLSYAQRLHTRKLISTIPTDAHPTGYIVSNAEDLLGLFDADFGVLVIGEAAKILGPNEHGQDILMMAEYLRLKQFKLMQVTQEVTKDFQDLNLPNGLNVIAGLLYVPLSAGGGDFIAFLRKGQLRDVSWAGRPSKMEDGQASLEPRSSFKAWTESIAGRCRAWTDEQLDTAGVLALVYGKFIEVWRQKESALKTTQLTNILLSNASHEVRTPLNHIINYLELALESQLDNETRNNLSMSHAASKNLLFTINDLLDLTRLESGNEIANNEPFDLAQALQDAVEVYQTEAVRRSIEFTLITLDVPKLVIGDARKIKTVVANLTANAVKYTEKGSITVECRTFNEPAGLRDSGSKVMDIIVRDTGVGIGSAKLESIFREFEQVEQASPQAENTSPGLGLGLAVVARIVEQLGGQLRVDSKLNEGSRFSFLVPVSVPTPESGSTDRTVGQSIRGQRRGNRGSIASGSGGSEIDSIVEALSASVFDDDASRQAMNSERALDPRTSAQSGRYKERRKWGPERKGYSGEVEPEGSNFPVRVAKVDSLGLDPPPLAVTKGPSTSTEIWRQTLGEAEKPSPPPAVGPPRFITDEPSRLRVLVVEDDAVNRNVLNKRLSLDGHTVAVSVNGQEAVDKVREDRAFDCILMDIQMPVMDGIEATIQIREVEKQSPLPLDEVRPSQDFNGRIPIFVVSASLKESQRLHLMDCGVDGWVLKPINYKRLGVLISGVTDLPKRRDSVYFQGCDWEAGGWFKEAQLSVGSQT